MPRNALAASICIEADSSGLSGKRRTPSVQRTARPRRGRADEGEHREDVAAAPGRTSSATPAKPTTRPAIAVERKPPAEERAIHQREPERDDRHHSAARPDSSRVSAQRRHRFRSASRAAPTIAAAPH